MQKVQMILALGVLGLLALTLLVGESAGYLAAMLLSLLALMVGIVFDRLRFPRR